MPKAEVDRPTRRRWRRSGRCLPASAPVTGSRLGTPERSAAYWLSTRSTVTVP